MSLVVIIPVYNRARTVLDALDSVANQTAGPDRVIVVDDGSTDDVADGLRDWIRSRSLAFPLEYIWQEHQGAGSARNRGIAASRNARWLTFLDSDDLWPRDFLQRTVAALRNSPPAVAATCDRQVTDTRTGQQTRVNTAGLAVDATRWLFVEGAAVASASVFDAALIRKLGGFKEHLVTGQDTELFLRLSRLGRWLHVRGRPIQYRRGLARSRGERDHIRHHQPDFALHWAQIREDFLMHEGRELAGEDSTYGIELAKRWQRAAKHQLACQNVMAARRCFRRALRWHWNATAAWRLARCYFRRAA